VYKKRGDRTSFKLRYISQSSIVKHSLALLDFSLPFDTCLSHFTLEHFTPATMIFLTPVANFVALALVGTSLANPVELERRGDKILLGYRTVSKVSCFLPFSSQEKLQH